MLSKLSRKDEDGQFNYRVMKLILIKSSFRDQKESSSVHKKTLYSLMTFIVTVVQERIRD